MILSSLHHVRVRSWVSVSAAAASLIALGGTSSIHAQRGAPPAPPMQVSLAGVRVVGPGAGDKGSELRAFNESPGTTLAVFVKAPAGAGIVEIDDDGSKLDAFTDDKGTSLLEEGRMGPFPKVSEDGTVGMIEIEVHARPSAGASSVSAQGSFAVVVAAPPKPTRVANVRLEAARAFKVGAANMTVKEVTASDEAQSVTFGLTRTVLKTIRDVKFLDAKGEPIEARRTGSGYMNESAELNYEVKTKDKVVTVEFEIWQNIRTVKVPFTVKAGLGL